MKTENFFILLAGFFLSLSSICLGLANAQQIIIGDCNDIIQGDGNEITKNCGMGGDYVKYGNVAFLSFDGGRWMGPGIKSGSFLDKEYTDNAKFGINFETKKITVNFKCNPDAITQYRKAIEKEPRFPFPYFLVALCHKHAGEQEWKTFSQKAEEILKVTTQIPGHDPDHDVTLGLVRKLFSE